MMGIGTKVKAARKAAGLSQQALADRAGVSQATISDLERGRNESSKDLYAIASALGLDVGGLMEGRQPVVSNAPSRGPVGIAPAAVTLDLDADCLVVWRQLQQLPPDDREEWRAKLDIAAAEARLSKLHRKPEEVAPPKPGQTKTA